MRIGSCPSTSPHTPCTMHSSLTCTFNFTIFYLFPTEKKRLVSRVVSPINKVDLCNVRELKNLDAIYHECTCLCLSLWILWTWNTPGAFALRTGLCVGSGQTWLMFAADIAKIFDRIWHRALLSKLPAYGNFEKLSKWITSFRWTPN